MKLSQSILILHSMTLVLDSNKEKEMRSTLKSELQRLINRDDILILDGGNYIKGPFSFVFHSSH